MPIDFTEKLHGEIKKIALEFIRRFIKHHRMLDITDTLYYEMSEGYMDCIEFDDLDEEERKELIKKDRLFMSYDKGRIHKKLSRMHSRAFCRNLEEHIRNCEPSTEQEKMLLELIGEGMSLISENSPHIMNYDYDYASDKGRDFDPPPLESQILLAYALMDEVTKDVENCFSCECRETYNLSLIHI